MNTQPNNNSTPAPQTQNGLETTNRKDAQLATRRSAVGGLLTLHRRPLPAPRVAAELPELSAFAQVAEMLRYNLHACEYAISPDGSLRAWIGLLLVVGIVVAAPCIGLALILGILLVVATLLGIPLAAATAKICATLATVFHSLAAAAASLLAAVGMFIQVGGEIVGVVMLVLMAFFVIRAFHRAKNSGGDAMDDGQHVRYVESESR